MCNQEDGGSGAVSVWSCMWHLTARRIMCHHTQHTHIHHVKLIAGNLNPQHGLFSRVSSSEGGRVPVPVAHRSRRVMRVARSASCSCSLQFRCEGGFCTQIAQIAMSWSYFAFFFSFLFPCYHSCSRQETNRDIYIVPMPILFFNLVPRSLGLSRRLLPDSKWSVK